MTVTTAYSVLTYNCNGSVTAFSVTWPFFLSSDLVVTHISATGVETVLTLTTDYTISGGRDGTTGLPGTGTVTTVSTYAAGHKIRITRATPKTQQTAITSSGAFPAKTVEAMIDRVHMIAEEGRFAGGTSGVDGASLRLKTSGSDDYWDGEDYIARGFADGEDDNDLVTVRQLNDLISGEDFGDLFALKADLSSDDDPDKGSNLVGYIPSGTGWVATTVRDKLRLFPLHLQDFGFVEGLAVSDAVAEANVTAAQACLDAAGVAGRPVYFDFQYGVFKGNGLRFPSGVHAYGRGVGYWNPVYHQNAKGWYGTNLIFKGASGAVTKYTATGITSMRYAGGRREDPDNPGEYFELTSLMNADASGTTPATPKQLSVAITGKDDAVNWGLHGCRVVPWLGTDGVADYSNQSNTALSHPWDIGVLIDDHEGVDIEDVQAVGHWRVFGGAIISPGYTDWGHVERNSIRRCMFQGVTGFGIRGADQWKVSATTSNTATIRWSEESYWPASGQFLGIAGNVAYTYTGTTRVGNDLRFDGVTPNPTGIFQLRSVKTGSGIAGTNLYDVLCHGLEHEGGGDSESLGLPISKAFEASGAAIRGVEADVFKTQSLQERCLVYFHDVSDFLAKAWQVEGSQANIVASPATALSTATAPVGDSRNIRIAHGIGFLDVKNNLWTPRSQFRPGDQIAPRDELEDALLFRALSGQDVVAELSTGKKFIVRDDGEVTLFSVDEATGNGTLTGELTAAGATFQNTGLHLLDTNASHDLIIKPGSNLTADRTFTLTTGDANRTLDISAADVAISEFAATLLDDTSALALCKTLGVPYVITDAPRLPHTGTTTETTLATVTLPAGAMGPNGFLRITAQWRVTNNANVKTPRIRLGGTGGTAFLSGSLTTSLSTRSQIQIHNVNSASSQVGNAAAPAGAFVSTANDVVTGTLNTAAAQDIVFSGQLANAADEIELVSYLIEVFYKA